MIGSLLCLVLAQSQAPAHASLHPEVADVYLELGELPALWKAYEEAPLARLLRDEKVSAFLRGLGLEIDASPARQLQSLIESELAPESVERWFGGLETASVSLVATAPSGDAKGTWALTAIADFAEAAQCEAAKETLLARASAHAPLDGPVPGAERLTLAQPPLELWCAALESRLIVGGGDATPASYRSRADGGSKGLDVSQSLQRAKFAKPEGATIFWYAQRRSPLDVLSALMPGDSRVESMRTVLAELPPGMDILAGERTLRMQLAGGRFVTEILSSDAGATTKSILGGQPVQEAWLEPIPPQMMLAYATALDGSALAGLVKSLIGKDESSSTALAALEEKLGFGVERILSRLGPGLTVYSPAPAGPGIPELRAWVDCSDADGFQADLERFVGALGETIPGFTLKTRGYRVTNDATGEKTEIPVSTLTLPQGMARLGPVTPSPSYARVGNRLVFALSSSNVKSELKRIHGGEGDPIVAGENVFKKEGVELPDDVRSFVQMDWGNLIGSMLNLLKTLGPMFADSLPFDLASVPQAQDVTRYFEPTVHYSQKVAGGTYRRNVGSFGPETWLAIAGVVGSSRSPAPPPVADPAGKLTFSGAIPDDQQMATDRAFDAMTTGLERFVAELERYPADAAELTKPSAKFPDGYLPGNVLPVDGWGRPLRYERRQESGRFWSTGPNGIDEGGAGDDVLPGAR